LLEKLTVLAPKMTALRLRRCAVLRYLSFAAAVYWSDEMPRRLDDDEEDIVRILLRYRTTLILGQPDKELEPYWEAAKQCFPGWIGFSAARVAPNPSVVDFFHDQKERSLRAFRRALEEDE
jgi:hypothetical protein